MTTVPNPAMPGEKQKREAKLCAATTNKGEPCQNLSTRHGKFCGSHTEQLPSPNRTRCGVALKRGRGKCQRLSPPGEICSHHNAAVRHSNVPPEPLQLVPGAQVLVTVTLRGETLRLLGWIKETHEGFAAEDGLRNRDKADCVELVNIEIEAEE